MSTVQYNEYIHAATYGIYDGAPIPPVCPYCGAIPVEASTPTVPTGGGGIAKTLYVGFCRACGWWWADFRDSRSPTYEEARFYKAILRRVSLSERDLGTVLSHAKEALRDEHRLLTVSPRDFEHLIGQVFADIFVKLP
jgi:hypothetical protein